MARPPRLQFEGAFYHVDLTPRRRKWMFMMIGGNGQLDCPYIMGTMLQRRPTRMQILTSVFRPTSLAYLLLFLTASLIAFAGEEAFAPLKIPAQINPSTDASSYITNRNRNIFVVAGDTTENKFELAIFDATGRKTGHWSTNGFESELLTFSDDGKMILVEVRNRETYENYTVYILSSKGEVLYRFKPSGYLLLSFSSDNRYLIIVPNNAPHGSPPVPSSYKVGDRLSFAGKLL